MATEQLSGRGMPESTQDQGTMSQVQQQVQDKAKDVKADAVQRVREQLDTRSTELGGQVQSLSHALRRSAEELEGEGKNGPAGVARQVAERVDHLGGYLKDSNSTRFLEDVESFARSRPWATAGIGAMIGLAASRFLKASSSNRYAQSARAQADLDAPVARDRGSVTPARPPASPGERRQP
jgi:ElaB/YqjD/DUF883 family membrane-anchored ribosome-binding protein